MFRIKYKVLTLLLILISLKLGYSQDKTDSLTQVLNNHIEEQKGDDAFTADILAKLYLETHQTQPLFSLQYAARALEIYTNLNDTNNIALMHTYIGDNYFNRKIYNMAMQSYTKSYDMYAVSANELQEAYVMLKIGDTYLAQNLASNASEEYFLSLDVFKKHSDKEGLSHTYDRIANIKLQEYSQETSLKYLDSALLLRRSLRNDALIALSYENIANAHIFNENYELADKFLEKALTKYKVSNSKIKVADIYLSFGNNLLEEEKYSKAKDKVLKALEIYQKYAVNSKIAKSYNTLGIINYKKNAFSKAEKYAQMAIQISIENVLPEEEKEAYKLLSNIYIKLGDYKKAFGFLEKYSNLVNSIIETERSKQSTELQVNLATQKKEQQIKLLKKNKELQDAKIKKNEAEQKTLYYGVALLLFILISSIVFGYYLFKANKKTKATNNLLVKKNKHIQQQNDEINLQKNKLEYAYDSISKQKDEIENKNKKIFASINYASRIQKAMLPKISEIRQDLPESFVMLSPRDLVSGDFFWYGKTQDENDNEKIIITAVDCTGHGVPGAFMSMIGDAYLNQIIYQQKINKPEEILTELHKGINTSLKQGTSNNSDGMDMALCVIDKAKKTIEFAGAKNPLVYFQDDESNIIKGDINSIGGFSKGKSAPFTGHEIKITKPTYCYLYSDGFQDQFGGENKKKYMAKRFRLFLQKIHKMPFDKQAEILDKELKVWRKQIPQMDDVLIVGFKIEP